MSDDEQAPPRTTTPHRCQGGESNAAGASSVWVRAGLLLLLLIGSIALTSMTSMCSNRGIGKLIRRLEHRYGSDN